MLNRFACVTLAIAAVTAGAGAADTAKIYTDATSSIVLAVPADQKVSVMQGDKVTIEDIPAEFERVRKDTKAVDTCQGGQIERLTNIVEGRSSWVFANSGARAISGKTYTIYGRGFIADALEVYTVYADEIDAATSEPKGAPVAQEVTAVTESTIVFKAQFPYPDMQGRVDFKTTFVVYEGASVVPGPDRSDHTWAPQKPTVAVVEGQSCMGARYHVQLTGGLDLRLIVSDVDHGLGEIVNLISAVSSDQEQLPNNAVSFELALEGAGDGATVIMKVDPAKLNETAMVDKREYTLTVTVKDPVGLESVIQLGMVSQIPVSVIKNGYHLIMKMRGSDGKEERYANDCEKFGYDTTYWENDALLNKKDASLTPANAKYEGFTKQKFKTIRLCGTDDVADDTRCHEHTFAKEWDSAKVMFKECGLPAKPAEYKSWDNVGSNGNNCRTSEDTREMYDNVFQFSGARDCPVSVPGFSQNHFQAAARWGYMANAPGEICQFRTDNTHDVDAAIGIGLRAEGNQCKCGAGATPRAFHNQQNGEFVRDCRYCQDAFLWAKCL